MNIAKIEWSFMEFPEADTSALTIYVSGCHRACIGCHNSQLFDYDIGDIFDDEYLIDIIQSINKSEDKRLVILGGEPLVALNSSNVRRIISESSKYSDICLYTSYDMSEAKKILGDEINKLKYIKTGRFEVSCSQQSIKNADRMILASSNQIMWHNIGNDFEPISDNGIINFK